MKSNRTVLLTGAGFTYDFGGFLGSQMWSVILNQTQVRDNRLLRDFMLKDHQLNYETVYDNVLKSDFAQEVKDAFTNAVRNAYQELDKCICKIQSNKGRRVSEFLLRFASFDTKSSGFIFTLNQDLLVERWYKAQLQLQLVDAPLPDKFKSLQDLALNDWIQLPQEEQVEQYKSSFYRQTLSPLFYIKLHGSYGWKGRNKDALVIGTSKADIIKEEPLLRWYLSLFSEILAEGDKNLVVVGYGFRDEHINEIIANSINRHRLNLYVISPSQPVVFREQLQTVNTLPLNKYGPDLWKGLAGYFCTSVQNFYDLDPHGDLIDTQSGIAFYDALNL